MSDSSASAPKNEGDEFPDVERLIQTARRYEFADGLRDLQLAAVVALVGGVAAFTYLPQGIRIYIQWAVWFRERWGRLAAYLPLLLFFLVLVLMMAGSVRVMSSIRRRWLWRESGSAQPRTWGMSRPATILAALVLLISIVGGVLLWMAGVVEADFALRMIWTASGWAMGIELYVMGRSMDLPRYRWIGGLGGLASSALLFLPISFGASALVFAAGWAITLAASGVVTLYVVRRRQGQEQHDG
ncbi:MAG: hypothetical protein PVF49_02350 [Anaerolineales bacterium]|jgi:hypothetical protein